MRSAHAEGFIICSLLAVGLGYPSPLAYTAEDLETEVLGGDATRPPRFPSFAALHEELFDVRPSRMDNSTHVVLGYSNPHGLTPKFNNFPFANLKPDFVLHVLDFLSTGGARFVVEVGSFHGHSAVVMATVFDTVGLKRTPILCIDPFSGDLNMWTQYRKDPLVRQWVRIADGRMLMFDQFMVNVQFALRRGISSSHILPFQTTSTVGARWLEHTGYTPDLVFIDSAHEAIETFFEVARFYRVLVPGGVIFGDDMGWPAVKRDVLRFVEATKRRGPTMACEFHIVRSEPGSDKHFWLIRKPKVDATGDR